MRLQLQRAQLAHLRLWPQFALDPLRGNRRDRGRRRQPAEPPLPGLEVHCASLDRHAVAMPIPGTRIRSVVWRQMDLISWRRRLRTVALSGLNVRHRPLPSMCSTVVPRVPTTVVSIDTAGRMGAGLMSFHNSKMRIRSKVSGQQPAYATIQCRQTSRPCPCKQQEIGIGHLSMPRELDITGERS